MPETYVVGSVRTAVGTFGGSLKDEPPCELGAAVAREALARANVPPDSVGHVVFGQVIATEPRDYYLARVIAVAAGVPAGVPALTVNRLCGSGLSRAIAEGRFASQIMGVEVSRKCEGAMIDTGEQVRPDATLAELRSAFRREGGTVTAGNTAGINDGAAAAVLATARARADPSSLHGVVWPCWRRAKGDGHRTDARNPRRPEARRPSCPGFRRH